MCCRVTVSEQTDVRVCAATAACDAWATGVGTSTSTDDERRERAGRCSGAVCCVVLRSARQRVRVVALHRCGHRLAVAHLEPIVTLRVASPRLCCSCGVQPDGGDTDGTMIASARAPGKTTKSTSRHDRQSLSGTGHALLRRPSSLSLCDRHRPRPSIRAAVHLQLLQQIDDAVELTRFVCRV